MTTAASTTAIVTVTADGIGAVPVTVTEHGGGRPFLLLHGGAGPQSVDGFRRSAGGRGSRPGCWCRPTRGSAARPARRAWTACPPWPASMPGCSTNSG